MKRSEMPPRAVPLARSALKSNASGHHKPAKAKRPRDTGPSSAVLRILQVRSEGLCEFWQCLDDAHHSHHRRPRKMGGSSAPDTNLPSNLLRLCPPHHDWIESNRSKALELGLLLHATAKPAEVPVYLRYGLVLLGDDGTWTATNDAEEES